jgi:sigma-B regulation protein RsbU (phosphoserine phosphatase)
MATVTLTITEKGRSRQVQLEPKGMLIGRDHECQIMLDSWDVSRKHARIFRDPFDRWIIEDLGSHNGIFVNGERVQAHAILSGELVNIGSCSLSIEPSLAQQIERDDSVQMTSNIVKDDFKAEIISSGPKTDKVLSRSYLQQLNEINKCLSELTSPSALYPEVCRRLAQVPKTVAAVLRVPKNTEALPESPEILACHLGDSPNYVMAEDMANLYLSHRVLEAVRATGNPVMAQSISSSDTDMVLTLSDEHTPRVVICAPLSAVTEEVDLLYLDTLIEQTTPDTFEFVQAVARQVILTRKSLISMQAKAERQILDQQLALAHDIQTKLAPRELEQGFEVDVAICYKPAMWVGGDYYDVWSLENGQIAFAVGDVSGKGLPAAMIMSNLQAALRTTMNFCSDLSKATEHVNQHLCQNLRDDMFVTLFLGLFDPSQNKLTYVNAGHILPLIMHPSEPARMLGEATNIPLGIFESPFTTAVETIDPKTSLLVVTDGITEAGSPDGQLFEIERLAELMTTSQATSAKELIKSVINSVTDFRQALPQQDDITVFALVN